MAFQVKASDRVFLTTTRRTSRAGARLVGSIFHASQRSNPFRSVCLLLARCVAFLSKRLTQDKVSSSNETRSRGVHSDGAKFDTQRTSQSPRPIPLDSMFSNYSAKRWQSSYFHLKKTSILGNSSLTCTTVTLNGHFPNFPKN